MPTLAPPLAVGQLSTNAVHANDLGNVYFVNGSGYRLVKAAAAITTPASLVLTTALSSGVPTWNVNTSTTLNDYTAAGVVPASITATIPINSYFLLQVSGPTTVIAVGTITIGTIIGTSTTAGQVINTGITAGVGDIGVILTAGSAAAAAPALLKGLI